MHRAKALAFGRSSFLPARSTCLQTYGIRFLITNAQILNAELRSRPTSSAATHPREDGVKPPQPISLPPLPGHRRPNRRNIVVNDLRATIDAHKAANELLPVRKVYSGPDPQHCSILDSSGHGVNSEAPKGDKQLRELESLFPLGKSWDLEKVTQQWPILDSIGRSTRPWQSYMSNQETDICGIDLLSREVEAFESFITPTRAERRAAKRCIDDLKDTVSQTLPSAESVLHGSRATGLAVPFSDVDLYISLSGHEREPGKRGPSQSSPQVKRAAQDASIQFAIALKNSNKFDSVNVITSRIRLVQARHLSSNLLAQVSFNIDARPARESTIYYLSELPHIRPLYLIIRHALRIHDFPHVIDGGVSSYAVFVMILTALKQPGARFEAHDYARQLLHILDFWSSAQTSTYAFSADPSVIFRKRSKRLKLPFGDPEDGFGQHVDGMKALAKSNQAHFVGHHQRKYTQKSGAFSCLCIQDPANPKNDLGKNSYRFRDVQGFFRAASREMKTKLNRWDASSLEERKGLERDSWGIITTMLIASYADFLRSRGELERFGRDLYEEPRLFE